MKGIRGKDGADVVYLERHLEIWCARSTVSPSQAHAKKKTGDLETTGQQRVSLLL